MSFFQFFHFHDKPAMRFREETTGTAYSIVRRSAKAGSFHPKTIESWFQKPKQKTWLL